MSIQVTSWDAVDQASYDSAYALLSQLLGEGHPELDGRRGVINDNVLQPLSVLAASLRIEEANWRRSSSLLAISQNPNLVDQDTVNNLFSNYFLTPQSGATAVGLVTVVLTQQTPVVIPSGFVFTAGTLAFATTASIAARLSEADILSASDVLLTEQQDGTWTFTFSVTAQAIGTASNIPQKTTLTPSGPVANFSAAYAAQDFTGGRDADTTASLLSKIQGGLSAKTWSNIPNIKALVNSSTLFYGAGVSVTGAGALEQLRDKHSVFPVTYGNRLDVWVKQPGPVATTTVSKQATYLGPSVDGPLWQLTLTRDDLPGFYAIQSVLRDGRAQSAEVVPQSVARGYNTATGDPDIVNALEAGFSRYQTAVIQFVDSFNTGETLVAGATALYDVTGMVVQFLDQLQAFLDSSATKPPGGDVVVRGAVPFIIQVEVQVDNLPESVPVDTIASTLAEAINVGSFAGTLYASTLASLTLPLLPSGVNLRRIKLVGMLFKPDGTKTLYRQTDYLTAPTLQGLMVSPQTVGFFSDPSYVAVNAVNQ